LRKKEKTNKKEQDKNSSEAIMGGFPAFFFLVFRHLHEQGVSRATVSGGMDGQMDGGKARHIAPAASEVLG